MGTRIVIIGNAGGGKTTAAKALGEARGIPVHSLDLLQWRPGWQPTPAEEFDRQHDELLEAESWIIEGFASWESIERRFAAADTIVLLDLPLRVHYWWAMKRQFVCLFRPRPDFVQDCPMLPMTGKLLKLIRHIHLKVRPHLLELVDQHSSDKFLYHIHTPKELREFLKQHCVLGTE